MLVGSAIGFLTWFCPVLIGWAEWEMQVIDSRILRDPAVFLFLSLSGLLSLSLFLFPLSLSPSLYSFLCMPVLCNSELKKVPFGQKSSLETTHCDAIIVFLFFLFLSCKLGGHHLASLKPFVSVITESTRSRHLSSNITPVQLFLCCSLLISFFPFTFVSPPFAHGEQDSYIDEAIAFFNPLPGGFYYYYSYYVLSTRSRSSTARPLHVPCSLNVQSSSFSFLPVVALILLFFCCHSLHLLIQSDHRVLFYFALVQTHRSVWEALS